MNQPDSIAVTNVIREDYPQEFKARILERMLDELLRGLNGRITDGKTYTIRMRRDSHREFGSTVETIRFDLGMVESMSMRASYYGDEYIPYGSVSYPIRQALKEKYRLVKNRIRRLFGMGRVRA